MAALVAANPHVARLIIAGRAHCHGGGRAGRPRRLPDQSPGGCALCRQFLPEQGQTERTRVTHQPRQDPGAPAIRNQPKLGECLHEARRARGQDEIAGERDLGAGARRHSVDRRNDGQRQLMQREDQRFVVPLDRIAQIDRRRAGRHGPIREILTGAKSAPRPGEHQDTRAAAARLVQCMPHLGVHPAIEAVEFFGPVQCQAGDAAVDAE